MGRVKNNCWIMENSENRSWQERSILFLGEERVEREVSMGQETDNGELAATDY